MREIVFFSKVCVCARARFLTYFNVSDFFVDSQWCSLCPKTTQNHAHLSPTRSCQIWMCHNSTPLSEKCLLLVPSIASLRHPQPKDKGRSAEGLQRRNEGPKPGGCWPRVPALYPRTVFEKQSWRDQSPFWLTYLLTFLHPSNFCTRPAAFVLSHNTNKN